MKSEIIKEILNITKLNDGKPPGAQLFSTQSGIKKSVWYPNIWLRWSDALNEAGLSPNSFQKSYKSIDLIHFYINLIRENNSFPIEGELRIKRKSDSTFPSHSGFNQLGSKLDRAKSILEFCKNNYGYDDIVIHCEKVIANTPKKEEKISDSEAKVGYVYLMRHGKRNEYKIGRTYNPIRREGEIKLELPEKIEPIHTIKTDDPSGIENYWHRRFSAKRKQGEWFELNSQDVNSFKKWKIIC